MDVHAPHADPMNVIHQQIMWDRLISVVEEQAQTLIRIGFSTSTREAGDVSAGVFNTAGHMLAQAVTGTPGHVNSMARAVVHFLDKFPATTMQPGDIFITNDPWKGTGHLHDFTVVTPVFRADRLVALFASTCHVIDIGGRGMGPDARQVFEEGVFIPIMRFASAAGTNETLLEIIKGNVREPVQVVGDLYSLAGCNDVGGRQLLKMMDEFGIETLDRLGDHILERSRVATLEAIRALPKGTFRNSMRVDGYDRPLDLVATMTISDDGIDVDFAGTSPPSSFGINVPFCYTEAYASFGVKCIIAPKIPNNEGSLALLRMRAPADCILNAQPPLPVATRHIVGQMLPDLVIGCLGQALHGNVPAEGTSCLWNLFAFGGSSQIDADSTEMMRARVFNVMSFHSGGTGARPGKDGLSATAFPSGVRNVPVEVTEAMSPLLIKRKEYRTDSGGPGQFRGGLGQVMEVVSLDDTAFAISANYDRVDFPARGRDGGADGKAGKISLGSGRLLKSKGQQTIPRGEAVLIEMPGGGGLGDPFSRDAAAVAADVHLGMVSREAAETAYGVVLRGDHSVDETATAARRGHRA
ncbi:5-oxoprolinase (ATP-hydrolyzing) [Rhodopseudomonas palustris HaA2]|uniref:5-oxoprolinase (ATP-hydrolyzing) n=1 Tax=Rhodopseudomonas palustris (strain HaA2) TaxID=316058 RepID=Q2IRP5_RHOP2|nr:hydantoinase B/oxoprolinase family protein [Rhodopseudomonas palustris]ABD09115.1 5-oxoprolinase (ATP-hydrolyzing) [Rhodopseudomonas palustris HaA2]